MQPKNSNVGFNRERTNKRNVLNDADFNEVRMPEFGQEQQLSFEKSDGETKSKVGGLISQFQEFANQDEKTTTGRKGAVESMPSKQRTNTGGSTNAETVVADDSIARVVWTK